MKPGKHIQYYVEGENEVKLLNVLKTDMQLILAGKVQKFNVIEQDFTELRLRTLKPDTTVVLVFDTDMKSKGSLETNILMLKNHPHVKNVILVPQVKTLQEELKRACGLKNIKELLGSESEQSFKHDFNKIRNLPKKLREKGFRIELLWNQTPKGVFCDIANEAKYIKFASQSHKTLMRKRR